MRRRLTVIAALAAMVLAVASPTNAIQYGKPDGNGHPYVGLMVALEDQVPLWRCTGTLISEDVFLTAGHCVGVDPDSGAVPDDVQIWFTEGPEPFDPGFTGVCDASSVGYPCVGQASGTPNPLPGWNGSLTLPDTHDLGIVTLDAPYPMAQYGELPDAGLLDSLASRRGLQDVSMTVVGYGVQSEKPTLISVRQRYVATTTVVQLVNALTDGYNVRLSSNPGHWSGGTCFGDSGGPVFYNDTRTIVAVNSFVLNLNCKGSGYGFRVDTSRSLEFVDGFLGS